MTFANASRPRVPRAARQGCVRNPTVLNLSTINVRTARHDDNVDMLIKELDKVNAGIVAIQETKRKDESTINWRTGHLVFIGKSNRSIGGVGFIIHPDLKQLLEKCYIINHRLAVLKLNINGTPLKCINVYMPTSDYDDDYVDEMYENIENELTGASQFVIF